MLADGAFALIAGPGQHFFRAAIHAEKPRRLVDTDEP